MFSKLKQKFKYFHVASDLIYSMAAVIILNGVTQLIVNPYMDNIMQDSYGTVLYLFSIVSVMAASFGTGANYSRMMSQTKRKATNGDYNIFLCAIFALCVIVSAVSLILVGWFNLPQFIMFTILMIVSVARFYGDVEFRMNLNYKGYFIYYTSIAVGYLIGLLVFRFTKVWGIVFILGESLSILYVKFRGSIFKKPYFKRSEYFKANIISMLVLSGTELIGALILHADRIMIRLMIDEEMTRIFYKASLMGKVIALLTVPLNGVIIGYLARYKGKFTTKKFLNITGITVLIGIVFTIGCTFASHIFVLLFYPHDYITARPYFLIANAGQIVFFISNTLMVILLRFSGEKYQLYINIVYAVLFVAIVIPMTYFWGLFGAAAGLLSVNVIKFAIVTVMGCYLCRNKIQGEN